MTLITFFPSRSLRYSLSITAALTMSVLAQEAPQAPQQPAPQPGGNVGTRDPNQGNQRERQPGFDPRDQRQQQQQQQQFPEMQRPIFLSGKVMMEDGTPPPELVTIERVCNGSPRPEGYTDSKGRFSFQLGQNTGMMSDASVSSTESGLSGPGGMPQRGNMGMGSMGGRGGFNERDLIGCELRASLPGFRSENVNLTGRRVMDNPDVGTIVLRRLAKVDGFTFSGTTSFAPKDARKSFEKGMGAIKKQKFEDAERELQKATGLYPKYAVAWYELGRVYQQQKKIDQARNAYAESLKADVKFVSPYPKLAQLAAAEQKWQEAADYAGQLLKLNPYDYPDGYFLSAVANLNLNKLDPAEEHAREALKLDPQHRNPKINHLLGIILAQKKDYTGAAANMRDYLRLAPKAGDADVVKQQLAEVERVLGKSEAAAAPTPAP